MKKRVMKQTLQGKFHYVEEPEAKHDRIAFYHNGKKVATTGFSRGAGPDIGDPSLLAQMAKEVRVNQLSFFKRMIECTRSYDDYIKRLREGRYI
jgi:hypothetical protein